MSDVIRFVAGFRVTGDHLPDLAARVQASAHWLAQADSPKLFVNAEPGAILRGAERQACRS